MSFWTLLSLFSLGLAGRLNPLGGKGGGDQPDDDQLSSVQESWEKFRGSFIALDVMGMMQAYDEEAIVRVYDGSNAGAGLTTAHFSDADGNPTRAIPSVFHSMFHGVPPKYLNEAIQFWLHVEEDPGQVFTVWSSQKDGILLATETLYFDEETFKITQHNIVLRTGFEELAPSTKSLPDVTTLPVSEDRPDLRALADRPEPDVRILPVSPDPRPIPSEPDVTILPVDPCEDVKHHAEAIKTMDIDFMKSEYDDESVLQVVHNLDGTVYKGSKEIGAFFDSVMRPLFLGLQYRGAKIDLSLVDVDCQGEQIVRVWTAAALGISVSGTDTILMEKGKIVRHNILCTTGGR